MLAPVQMLSATRQNLWRLTFIRILVLAAQAGSVGMAWLFDFSAVALAAVVDHFGVLAGALRADGHSSAHLAAAHRA